MSKILVLALVAGAQLAPRQKQDQQVPGMPGAGDIATCTASGDCPYSLATSECLGSVSIECRDEVCAIENLGQCVACATRTGAFGSWSVAALQQLCPDVPMNATNGTAPATAPGNATAAGNTTAVPGNATAPGNTTAPGNATGTGAGNATGTGNGTLPANTTAPANGTAPAGGDARAPPAAPGPVPAAALGVALALAGAALLA